MMPVLSIGTTTRCNGKCSFCYRGRGGHGVAGENLDPRVTADLLRELQPAMVQLSLFGEPLLDPDLEKHIAACRSWGTWCVVNTNGALLADRAASLKLAGLNSLVVSCHGIGERHDRRQPGIPFAEVERGILVARDLGMQVRVFNSLWADVGERVQARDFWKERGVVMISAARYRWPWPGGARAAMVDPCPFTVGQAVVDADGSILGCCVDWQHDLHLGFVGTIRVEAAITRFRREGQWQAAEFCRDCPQYPQLQEWFSEAPS